MTRRTRELLPGFATSTYADVLNLFKTQLVRVLSATRECRFHRSCRSKHRTAAVQLYLSAKEWKTPDQERGEADEEAVVAPKPGPNSDEERGNVNEEPQSPNSPPP